jgi:hypothetical protein
VREPRRSSPGPLLAIAGMAILLGVLACTAAVASQISSGCACTYPPTHPPGWTPSPSPPVSISAAQAAAARFTGVPMTASGSWRDLPDRTVIEATGKSAYAVVDGFSGEVLQAVVLARIPEIDPASISASGAVAAATDFLTAAAVEAAGLTATASQLPQNLGTGFEVRFATSGAAPADRYRVFVNGPTGQVFAFESGQWSGQVPVVGRAEAVRRAQAAIPEAGQVVLDAELVPDLSTGQLVWTWQIGLGVPTGTEAQAGETVYSGGGYVTVDATSGVTTVVKKG